jgi:hypothetical protein
MSSPRLNPPRRSLFAVWCWPWWVWVVAPVILFSVYVLSCAPVFYVLLNMRPRPMLSEAYETAEVFYWPITVCIENSPTASALYFWEMDMVRSSKLLDWLL